MPLSVRCLNLDEVKWRHPDAVSEFLNTNGRQFQQIRLLGERILDIKEGPLIDEKVQNLLEAIVAECPNLTSLHIAYAASPFIYRNFLLRHIGYIGGQLTNLRIDYSSLNDAVIDTIVESCKKLKRLYLGSDPRDGLDIDKSYAKLRTLPKLEAAKLNVNFHATDKKEQQL
ncbi:hypothetical protein HDE_10873 [Halotydeus destructor]|nr:hypothetical protein HDE_10873 [Halotydeus destructor]